MTKRVGFSLLAGLAAVVVLISAAIFVGFGGHRRTPGGDSGRTREPVSPAVAGQWVGTWSGAAAAAEPGNLDGYAGMSIRNVVHTSVGGTSVRIQLSNLFGTRPLVISHASVALAATPSNPTAAVGTMRRLGFGDNRPTVTIPAGSSVTSSPVRLDVPHDADLLVTTYSPVPSGPVTYHPYSRQTSYLAHGDRTEDTTGTRYTEQSPFWRYLTGVDVWSSQASGSVVCIGDSITDGLTSTVGANHRWTDYLAARLRDEKGAPRYGVLNEGISGNRLLVNGSRFSPNNGPSVLSRLDRDVFTRTDVKAVVLEIGLNDMFKWPRQFDPDKIVAGMRQVVKEAHAHGLRVTGGTLTPFYGHHGYLPKMNQVREAVNRQIRSGTVFDQVVDFDKALRDPAHPDRLRPAYDSGDHLHPSDIGYRAMARAVNLEGLKGRSPATT
ncbi:SGNH/GDSL hydrolase family protein [Streptomyces sp. NPDC059740]|uniref:SGNH/GDSL hydrolase family protein n=1 Tax=Streptomyces sp. NPDC059740 TaxID=3346926 RepID=UPI0036611EC0